MTPLSTDDFPYTIGYVSELLALDEPQLMTLVQTLGFIPKTEEGSGRTIFTHQELDLLKKAAELQRHGDDLETIGKHLGPSTPEHGEEALKNTRSPIPGASLLTTPPQVASQESASAPSNRQSTATNAQGSREGSRSTPGNYTQSRNPRVDLPGGKGGDPNNLSSGHASSRSIVSAGSSAAGADSITVMVEAVSQVKESILKDLAHLLDDKLAGLDEVVVELIRCKSENDSLKKRLNDAVRARESLEQELGRFKPVQFGFYRKL